MPVINMRIAVVCIALVAMSSASSTNDPKTTCRRMVEVLDGLLGVMNTYCREMELLLPCIEHGDTCNEMMTMLTSLIAVSRKYCSYKIPEVPNDCSDLYKIGCRQSGYYNIFLPQTSESMKVYCDMRTNGGGWLVFQKRFDNSVKFYRNWEAYKIGFGYLDGEFWLGNDHLNEIASLKPQSLRIDMADWDGVRRYAEYANFGMKGEDENYELSIADYTGDAGDSLSYADGCQFSTRDQDHDSSFEQHCAKNFKGGWWYKACHNANLNGRNIQAGNHNGPYAVGLIWSTWKQFYYSLKATEMKMRPRNHNMP